MTGKRMRLGELLLTKNFIDREQLNSALAFQRQWGHRLGTAMVALGFISEHELVEVLGEALNLESVDLGRVSIDEAAVSIVPHATAVENDLIPIALKPGEGGRKRQLTVAIADPLNVPALDEIEFTYDCRVTPVIAALSQISSAIRRHYLHLDTHVGPAPERPADGTEEEPETTQPDAPMAVLRGGQYVDIHEHEVSEPTNPEIAAEAGGIDVSGVPSRPAPALGVRVSDVERLERLQKYIYALLRILVRKGVINKEEFFEELER